MDGEPARALATALLWLIFPGYTLNLVRGYPEPFIVLCFLLSLVLAALTAPWLLAKPRRRRTLAFFAGWLPVLAIWAVLRLEVDDPARLESFSFHAFQRVYPHGFWLHRRVDGSLQPAPVSFLSGAGGGRSMDSRWRCSASFRWSGWRGCCGPDDRGCRGRCSFRTPPR